MSRRSNPPTSRDFAKALRASQTDAERRLWLLLRNRRLSGLKWRRQVPLGPYIVDFICFDRRVVVECDGSQHADDPRDRIRDDWLKAQGLIVVRFWNHEILRTPEVVIDTILARAGLPV